MRKLLWTLYADRPMLLFFLFGFAVASAVFGICVAALYFIGA